MPNYTVKLPQNLHLVVELSEHPIDFSIRYGEDEDAMDVKFSYVPKSGGIVTPHEGLCIKPYSVAGAKAQRVSVSSGATTSDVIDYCDPGSDPDGTCMGS